MLDRQAQSTFETVAVQQNGLRSPLPFSYLNDKNSKGSSNDQYPLYQLRIQSASFKSHRKRQLKLQSTSKQKIQSSSIISPEKEESSKDFIRHTLERLSEYKRAGAQLLLSRTNSPQPSHRIQGHSVGVTHRSVGQSRKISAASVIVNQTFNNNNNSVFNQSMDCTDNKRFQTQVSVQHEEHSQLSQPHDSLKFRMSLLRHSPNSIRDEDRVKSLESVAQVQLVSMPKEKKQGTVISQHSLQQRIARLTSTTESPQEQYETSALRFRLNNYARYKQVMREASQITKPAEKVYEGLQKYCKTNIRKACLKLNIQPVDKLQKFRKAFENEGVFQKYLSSKLKEQSEERKQNYKEKRLREKATVPRPTTKNHWRVGCASATENIAPSAAEKDGTSFFEFSTENLRALSPGTKNRSETAKIQSRQALRTAQKIFQRLYNHSAQKTLRSASGVSTLTTSQQPSSRTSRRTSLLVPEDPFTAAPDSSQKKLKDTIANYEQVEGILARLFRDRLSRNKQLQQRKKMQSVQSERQNSSVQFFLTSEPEEPLSTQNYHHKNEEGNTIDRDRDILDKFHERFQTQYEHYL